MPKDADGKETGWISKHAFQEGALSADDMGRQAMADGYVVTRMLDRAIRGKLSLIDQLEKRLKALEALTPPAEEELTLLPEEEGAPSEPAKEKRNGNGKTRE